MGWTEGSHYCLAGMKVSAFHFAFSDAVLAGGGSTLSKPGEGGSLGSHFTSVGGACLNLCHLKYGESKMILSRSFLFCWATPFVVLWLSRTCFSWGSFLSFPVGLSR